MPLYIQKKTSQRRISIGGKVLNHNYAVEVSKKEADLFSEDIEEVKEKKVEKKEVKKDSKKSSKK